MSYGIEFESLSRQAYISPVFMEVTSKEKIYCVKIECDRPNFIKIRGCPYIAYIIMWTNYNKNDEIEITYKAKSQKTAAGINHWQKIAGYLNNEEKNLLIKSCYSIIEKEIEKNNLSYFKGRILFSCSKQKLADTILDR